MRTISLLTLGLCASMAWAQPNDAPAPIKTGALPRVPASEIESRIRGFAQALSGEEVYLEAAPYVFGAKLGFFGGPQWAEDWKKGRGESRLQIERVESKIAGDTASAQVSYRWLTPLFRSEILQERLALRFGKSLITGELSWQIVPTPPDGAAPQPFGKSPPFLNEAATVIANPQAAVNEYRARSSQINLRQLGLAVKQFMQDYNDNYAFAPEYVEEALALYMDKDAEIWKVPGREEKYSFNDNLSEKNEAQVAKPAQTVLFYEGDDETPIFRYDGKAAIGFADGHAALVSPEEAKNLIWKP